MPVAIRSFAIAPLLLALAGCAGGPHLFGGPQPDVYAENLLATGNYESAMLRYQQLAQDSRYSDYYLTRAADAALRAGDGRGAQQLAYAVDPRKLDKADQNRLLLLQSRLDLNVGRSREAMAKLDSLAGERLEGGQAVNYHTLRSSAYNQLGDMLGSARERVELGNLLDQSEALQKNNQAIYEALARLPGPALAQNQTRDTLGGWVALTRILKSPPMGNLNAALDDWRAQYPSHPADGDFLQNLIEEKGLQVRVTPLAPVRPGPVPIPNAAPPQAAPTPATPPVTGPFVGVLLPLSGEYAQASQAIRSGMIAAHFADADPNKLPLRFVDSQSGDIYALYRKLADEGAQAVVGPLVKDQVAKLAQSGDLPVPVLGLNQAGGANNERLYQFGLAPEQDVEQSAGSAWADQRQNARVLAPATSYGQRLIKMFVGYWKRLGGKVLTVNTYPDSETDFSAPIHGLLGAATPDAPPPSSPSPTDFVFLVADAKNARLIVPQLAAQPGGQLPVYATSSVYAGNSTDPQANQDLNGLTFCDIPWLLNPQDASPLSAQALAQQIRQTPPSATRLIALGLDAYRLLPELDRLKADPQYRYPGATGSLTLKPGNRIQRQLQCARFDGGSLQSRGEAPLVQPGAPVQTQP